MATPPVTELTDRARDIFRAVVDSYLASGTPVGSKTIAQLTGLSLSPASIRGVMGELEGLGLLTMQRIEMYLRAKRMLDTARVRPTASS